MTFQQAEAAARAGGRLCLWEERAKWLYDAAASVLHLDGEFWECGCYRGGSAKLLAELLRDNPRPLRLFDTFSGFADVTPEDGTIHSPKNGDMFPGNDMAEEVLRFVDAPFASVHPGAIPAGFVGLEDSKIAFAYLDVDLYHPTKEALRFVLPRMVPGGMIVLDDCGDEGWPGVEKAANEMKGKLVLHKFSSPCPYDSYRGWQGRIQL
jgi:O-methyltransferase